MTKFNDNTTKISDNVEKLRLGLLAFFPFLILFLYTKRQENTLDLINSSPINKKDEDFSSANVKPSEKNIVLENEKNSVVKKELSFPFSLTEETILAFQNLAGFAYESYVRLWNNIQREIKFRNK